MVPYISLASFRSSHVMRIKEKLFGSTSPLVHQKTAITKEKEVGTHRNVYAVANKGLNDYP